VFTATWCNTEQTYVKLYSSDGRPVYK
jgi:hypothetical protein